MKGTNAVKSSDNVSGSSSSSSSSHQDLAAILQNYNRTTRVRTYNPDIRHSNSATALLRYTPFLILKALLLQPFLLLFVLERSAASDVVGSTLH